jgi:hypothetical protein
MLLSRPAAALLLACVAPVAFADALVKEWQVRYDTVSKLVRDRNFTAFQSYMGSDYTWTPLGGKKLNRKESIAAYAPIFKMKRITGGEEVIKAVRRGNRVEVTCDVRYVVTDQKGGTSRMHEVGVDTWERRRGTWKVIQTVTKFSESK